MIRNYLDVCLELPWGTYTKERLNVDAARKVLDRDHFGLTAVGELRKQLLYVLLLENA